MLYCRNHSTPQNADFGSLTKQYEATPGAGAALDLDYMWTGQRLDKGTGKYYMLNRHYDASLGKFLQRDPIGYAGGENIYAFGGGDPINMVDPSGLKELPDADDNLGKRIVQEQHYGHHQKTEEDSYWSNSDRCKNAYNCFSYAFDDGQGRAPTDYEKQAAEAAGFDWRSHPKYTFDPWQSIADQNYRVLGPDEPNVVGDRVVYVRGGDKLTLLEPGKSPGRVSNAEHAGIVTEVDDEGNAIRVKSKWGDSNLVDHSPGDVPKVYKGTTRLYFRRASPLAPSLPVVFP